MRTLEQEIHIEQRASEERFRALVEHSSDCIVVFDANARIKYVSPAVLRASGFTSEEMTGQDAFAGFHPEDRPAGRGIFEQLLQDPATPRSFRLRRRSKNGAFRWVEGIVTNLIADPKVQGIVVNFHDVSEQKKTEEILQKTHDELETKVKERTRELEHELTEHERAEEALRQSEHRFSMIFKAGPLAMSVSRLSDGLIFDANDTFLNMLGFHKEEVVGRSSLDLKMWTLEDRNQFIQFVRERRAQSVGIELRKKNGDLLHVLGSADVIEVGGEQCLLSMFIDNTKRKQAEERNRAYEEALRALASKIALVQEHERQRIAADLHDHIGQALAIAKMKLGELRPVEDVEEVRKLIDQAVQYTKSLTFELSPPILHELGLASALDWLAEKVHNEHGLLITVTDDGRPKPAGKEIRTVIFNAVREALVNIVKHAHATKVEISLQSENGSIRIGIEDDGAGFDTSTIRPYGKSGGFGIFYTSERLNSIGGRFEVESTPGQGTKIAITAPLETANREKAA